MEQKSMKSLAGTKAVRKLSKIATDISSQSKNETSSSSHQKQAYETSSNTADALNVAITGKRDGFRRRSMKSMEGTKADLKPPEAAPKKTNQPKNDTPSFYYQKQGHQSGT